MREQHRQSARTQDECNDAHAGKPLAQDGPRHEARPNRHGVGEDNHPRRRGGELRECGKQRERRKVQAAGHEHVSPRDPPGNPELAMLQQGEPEHDDRAEHAGPGAHGERWNGIERDLHRRPGHAPGEAQRDQHDARRAIGGWLRAEIGHDAYSGRGARRMTARFTVSARPRESGPKSQHRSTASGCPLTPA